MSQYRSFGDFFARKLRSGARSIEATGAGDWIAPCDGVLAAGGDLDGDTVVAKGRGFTAESLLADAELADSLRGGSYLTFYLSPRDYHRVHAPCDLEILGYRYVPGALFPVNPFFTERIDDIFAVNERLVIVARGAVGPIAIVLVGAAGVGNVTLTQPPVETRHFRGGEARAVSLSTPLSVRRGDELGAFQLGSTVILCTPRDAVDTAGCVALGSPLRFGERIARETRDQEISA